VLMCQRLLPDSKGHIYLQGAASFVLPKRHVAVKVYCSPHNTGAAAVAHELNYTFARRGANSSSSLDLLPKSSWRSSASVPRVGRSNRPQALRRDRGSFGQLLEVVDDLSACEHMLVYLNGLTWTHEPELLAADIREAMSIGVHLQPCHEFPSAIDPSSARHALEFKLIMDATPADLKKWPTNIYSQIAIALKGGELRDVGLTNLASKLSKRVPRAPVAAERALTPSLNSLSAYGSRHTPRISTTRLSQFAMNRTTASTFRSTSSDVNLGAERPGSHRDSKSRRRSTEERASATRRPAVESSV